ncbi:MAG: hypothetical protein ACD_42C00134G0003 [uncultured bacterium]|nr:MAG: hypothetical protein ACD_42C00134G0003 [uncultured bacterium]
MQLANNQQKTINNFVINAKYSEYNKQGEIKTIVTADKITQFQPDNNSVFTQPRIITYTDQDRTPWHIQADEGSSDQTAKKIILRGHVIAVKLKTKKTPSITIKTTKLTIFPKKSLAITNQPVVLSRPDTIIHGIGLTANLKTGEYQLHSQSKAIYVPTAQPAYQKRN